MMIRWAVGLLLLTGLAVGAAEPPEQLATAGVAQFTNAYAAWDGAEFAAAAARFRAATLAAPEGRTNFYWLGVAEFHHLLYLLGEPASRANTRAAETAREAALAALKTAVKLDDHDAESHALLGTLYGIGIAQKPVRALWLGPRVMNHEKAALEYGAENPRVRYLLGMSHYHAGALGGGKEEALRCLLKAEELYAAEAAKPAGPLEPRWGRGSCRAFLGKTYGALGLPAEARKYFRLALELNPHDPLAREELKRAAP